MADRFQQNDVLPALASAIGHADQGIAVYGADMVLRFANARYAGYLALPAGALKPGETRLIDVLRLLAERGDYGDGDPAALAQARLELLRGGTEPRSERELPNGVWLQLNRDRLPDGGLVVTLTDVTTIKCAEATLIASRDEAMRARRQLMTAIESMSEGFVLWDEADRLGMFNTRYRDE